MGEVHIPIIDEDKLDDIITALQALSAPSGTDVAISPTGMHIVTEDDVQGAISELDSAVDSVNASLTQLETAEKSLNSNVSDVKLWIGTASFTFNNSTSSAAVNLSTLTDGVVTSSNIIGCAFLSEVASMFVKLNASNNLEARGMNTVTATYSGKIILFYS